MLLHPHLITTAEEIQSISDRLKTKQIIAFDTEFIREKTFFPQLEIIQIATDEEAWLVDAQAFVADEEGTAHPAVQPLLDIFLDENILKVVHAAQADQECLHTSYNMVATPVMDTAIAASLCGLGENIGLANLLKSVLKVNIRKGYARTNWSVRPLPKHLIEYAYNDVVHLVELGKSSVKRLENMNRLDWALEISSQWSNPKLYRPDPDSIAKRLSKSGRINEENYPVLLELLRWREEKVRELNIPRRWLADDDVLMSLAETCPRTTTRRHSEGLIPGIEG